MSNIIGKIIEINDETSKPYAVCKLYDSVVVNGDRGVTTCEPSNVVYEIEPILRIKVGSDTFGYWGL